MKHLLGSLLLVTGVFVPSAGFASLQCTDIFTVREEAASAAPSVMMFHPELQSILQYNVQKAKEFQMSDAHFMSARTYEQMTFAMKNKVRLANELIDTVIQNILFLKFNQTPEAFQIQLAKMSESFLNMVAATWRIPGEQIDMIIQIRLNNEMIEMQAAGERQNARQPYIGFIQPSADSKAPVEKQPIGFGPRKGKTLEDDAPVEKQPIGFVPRKAENPNEAPVEKAPIGFIQFGERSNTPAHPIEPGFVPRKEAPGNMPKFILIIDTKTGDLDAINPDAKIGY